MYKDKKIIAIIPARGGSKGIKNKNRVEIQGKPLIQYTIDEAKQSKYIDKIFISTDCTKIAKIGQQLGLSIDHLRPKELSTDTSPTIDTLIYSLNFFAEEKFDYVLLLQPTQPLRKVEHIDEAIEKIIPGRVESIVSVNEIDEHPIFMRSIGSDGKLNPLLNTNSTIRRQDLSKLYKVNGAIYINKVEDILNGQTSLNDNKYPYLMDKQFDLDIDSIDDLLKFELLISKRR